MFWVALTDIEVVRWQPSWYYYHQHQLQIPCDTPTGDYTVQMDV